MTSPTPTSGPVYLMEMWPLFLLAQHDERTQPDHLIPENPHAFRDLLRPILATNNPQALIGMDDAEDAELTWWALILRASVLTDDFTFTPAWLTRDGTMMRGVARLLTLPFFERMDVWLAAMHQKGEQA